MARRYGGAHYIPRTCQRTRLLLRSRGLLSGPTSGTNWVFRDESMPMDFAFDVVRIVRTEESDLVDDAFEGRVRDMMTDAVSAEVAFA